jgi:hypothetical protein
LCVVLSPDSGERHGETPVFSHSLSGSRRQSASSAWPRMQKRAPRFPSQGHRRNRTVVLSPVYALMHKHTAQSSCLRACRSRPEIPRCSDISLLWCCGSLSNFGIIIAWRSACVALLVPRPSLGERIGSFASTPQPEGLRCNPITAPARTRLTSPHQICLLTCVIGSLPHKRQRKCPEV